ncbi:MAG: hypothetical protein RKH07_16140 [Gammaproteobacteria bacterium]
MKEQKWDDFDSGKELLEAGAVNIEPEAANDDDNEQPVAKGKTRVTEMRRRIEERLDSKRIALEYDYLMLDDLPDQLDSSENLQ